MHCTHSPSSTVIISAFEKSAFFLRVASRTAPNEEDGEYQRALQMLYGISFTIKMSPKSGYDIDAPGI